MPFMKTRISLLYGQRVVVDDNPTQVNVGRVCGLDDPVSLKAASKHTWGEEGRSRNHAWRAGEFTEAFRNASARVLFQGRTSPSDAFPMKSGSIGECIELMQMV